MLMKLQNSSEGMYLRRFDLYENTGTAPVSLEDTGSRWSKFLQKLTPWMIDNAHLGYVWRRELIPEVGFRYHLIICCHVDSARGEPVENTLLPAWQQCTTNSQAQIYSPLGHRGAGNNEIALRHAPEVLIKVVDSIKMMLDGERIGRLRSINGMPNWGSQDLRGMQKKLVAHGVHHG